MKNPIKAVIIDDEADGRNIIAFLLKQLFPSIVPAGEAKSVAEGVALLQNVQPDLVFLDVEMPDGNAFDLLSRSEGLIKNVILVTAYDHYAIRAVKASVLDYLLKPVDKQEFSDAVHKALARNRQEDISAFLPALLEGVRRQSKIRKVRIPTLTGFMLANADDILRCEASGNYTLICFKDGREIMASRTLGEYEEELSDFGFIRIHHKHLVNIDEIKEYNRGKNGGGCIQLQGSREQLEVSARKKQALLNALGNKPTDDAGR